MGLTPQQPQQGASSQMPLPQTAPPLRESQCKPSTAASPGFGGQPMPYTRPRPYHRASSPAASLVPQSAQVPGNLRVIVRAIKVPPFVFGLRPVYTIECMLSSPCLRSVSSSVDLRKSLDGVHSAQAQKNPVDNDLYGVQCLDFHTIV